MFQEVESMLVLVKNDSSAADLVGLAVLDEVATGQGVALQDWRGHLRCLVSLHRYN